jgi:hypothetical protein
VCGLEIEEHSFRISCTVIPSSGEIALTTMQPTPQPRPLRNCYFHSSIVSLFQARVGHRCGHPRDKPFVVPNSHESYPIRAAHFASTSLCHRAPSSSCTIVGTHGSKLKQLFAVGDMEIALPECRTLVFRQGASCHPCAFDQAHSLFQSKVETWKNVVIVCE